MGFAAIPHLELDKTPLPKGDCFGLDFGPFWVSDFLDVQRKNRPPLMLLMLAWACPLMLLMLAWACRLHLSAT